jgi:hypothetical protein
MNKHGVNGAAFIIASEAFTGPLGRRFLLLPFGTSALDPVRRKLAISLALRRRLEHIGVDLLPTDRDDLV